MGETLKRLNLPLHHDERGDLAVIELSDYVDWEVKRIYYVTNVTAPRGGHAVKGEKKIYVCMKGQVKARFHDGQSWTEFAVSGPNQAILMNENYYREFVDFSDDAVLMAISSVKYNPADYIYDLQEYINLKK